MKKHLFLAVVFALMASVIASTVYAGPGGMDMYSETNKLNSVAQVLGSISIRLESMALDQMSNPDPSGVANRLEAMGTELQVCYNRVDNVIITLPAPNLIPDNTLAALTMVYCESEGISSIADGFSYPPDPVYDPVRIARDSLIGYAGGIMNRLCIWVSHRTPSTANDT